MLYLLIGQLLMVGTLELGKVKGIIDANNIFCLRERSMIIPPCQVLGLGKVKGVNDARAIFC